MPKRSGFRSISFGSGWAPAHTTTTTLRPGLSFSASKMRCAEAVKSVVACGAYSSWTTLALEPTAARAAFTAATPSLPKA